MVSQMLSSSLHGVCCVDCPETQPLAAIHAIFLCEFVQLRQEAQMQCPREHSDTFAVKLDKLRLLCCLLAMLPFVGVSHLSKGPSEGR